MPWAILAAVDDPQAPTLPRSRQLAPEREPSAGGSGISRFAGVQAEEPDSRPADGVRAPLAGTAGDFSGDWRPRSRT